MELAKYKMKGCGRLKVCKMLITMHETRLSGMSFAFSSCMITTITISTFSCGALRVKRTIQLRQTPKPRQQNYSRNSEI